MILLFVYEIICISTRNILNVTVKIAICEEFLEAYMKNLYFTYT